jgi:hypothetical protein
LGEVPVVLAQKLLGFALCKRNLTGGQVHRVDDQNDFDWRVGRGSGSIELLKGKKLLRLFVIEKRKVCGCEASD